MHYFANHLADRYRPGELPDAVSIRLDSRDPRSIVGTAFQNGWYFDPGRERAEATWRLTIGKDAVEGRFVLRGGRFVELSEDAGL